MRRTAYKNIVKQLLIFTAVAGGLASCTSEEWQFDAPMQYNDALSIIPTVFNGTATRAETVPAEDQLNENLLVSLDVFVANAGQDAIINQWHLTTPSSTIESTVKSLLVNYWEKRTNLRKNNSYDVYVAANNEATKATIETVTGLMALSVTDANIIKKYKVDAGTSSDSPFTPEKTFAMDGTINNWTPDNDADEQVFEVDMKRAAAKIQVNVGFDQDFLDRLIYRYDQEQYENDGTLVWTDADGNALAEGAEKVKKDEHDQIHVTGTPAWRYVNFSKSAPIFADGALDEETEQGKRIFRQNMFFNALNSIEGDDKSFSITTYSYPMAWEKSLAINDAPFVMISVRFDEWDNNSGTNGEWKANYYYYRIPVCDENIITSLDRNKIYIVNATIDSYGSVGDNVEQEVTLEYEVMDWLNDDADNSNVIGKPLDFLMVSPLNFNLYGDGTQSVTLDAHSPNGKKVLVKEDVVVTWIDANGQERHDKVDGLQTVPGQATDGKITVSSTVMPNHAVKTITFTVYLEGHENDMAHTVTIKHFPVDNIQNFAGSWSSRWDGVSGGTTTVREYSWNPSADGWSSWDGYEDNIECTSEEYNSAEPEYRSSSTVSMPIGTPSNYDSRSSIEQGNNNTWRDNFREAVPEGNRQGANSEPNAYGPDASGYWYWGSDQTSGSNGNYDWRVWRGIGFLGYYDYYRWTNYYRRIYYKNVTTYKARRYYRDVQSDTEASTGDWVDWERDQTAHSTQRIVEDDNGRFHAHVYVNGVIRNINETWSYGQYVATDGATNGTTVQTNNHMYVIQITSTSDKYMLGKPIMGIPSESQSQDHVVSPAFMIASQLGVVTQGGGIPSFTGQTAADHCKTYMEVGTDGTRYTHWRLPTKEEIGVIVAYQNDRNAQDVITQVLGGQNYWCLDGSVAQTGTGRNPEYTFLRCVRDLTDEDLKRINGE